MSSKLVVTNNSELKEVQESIHRHSLVKAFANFFSYLFHPIFVPVYLVAFLLFVEPFLFTGASAGAKALNLLRVFVNYTFFPLISVLLLKALNLIGSVRLKDRKDRIIPFIVCNIWYFWLWYVWRNLPEIPREMVLFSMGVFLASSIGLLFNIYMKISMHGIALGTAVAFLCLLTFNSAANITIYLALAIFIAGVVGTSRLILSDHTPREYYWGLAVGVMAIVIANWVQ